MTQHFWLSNVRNDTIGGLVSALVAIPLAMGFGMFAFVSLGDEYFANGALAGLGAALVVGLASVLLSDKTSIVYAPRVNSTFFIGALLYGLVHSDVEALRSASLSLTLVVFFSIILLGGAFQVLFGLIRLGTLIKLAPHPVMAGFQNTAALLLFLIRIGNICGFDKSTKFTTALAHLDQARPLSVLVAVVTFVAMWNSRKLLPKVPPLIVGLAIGTGFYYALSALGLGHALGPVIGTTRNAELKPTMFQHFADLAHSGTVFELWPTILGGGLALAVIASIDALLCAKLVTQPGDPKLDGDPLLVRLGVGNMLAACFGGITTGINIGASLTSRTFGSRTPLSVLVNAAAIAVTITALFPIVTQTPRVVLSAVIMVVAIQHFDPWSIQLVKRIASGPAVQRPHLVLDFLVVLVVAVLSIVLNIALAVFLGIAIAVALFVVRMSRSIIRRQYRCDAIRSRKSRNAHEAETLERVGKTIQVMELQGALFFGTGDRLTDEIAAATVQDTRCLILDLRRVTEIDSTGARILLEISADLSRKGSRLLLALANHFWRVRQDSEGAGLQGCRSCHRMGRGRSAPRRIPRA